VARGRFRLDPKFAPALLRSAGVGRVLEEKLQSVQDRATELAPDDPATGEPDLKSSWAQTLEAGPHGLVGRLRNTNFKAHWHLFGTSKIPANNFLLRALEAEDGVTIAESDG
jgi:hypothetical protein